MSEPAQGGNAHFGFLNGFNSNEKSTESQYIQLAEEADRKEYERLARQTTIQEYALLKPFNNPELCRFGRVHATQTKKGRRYEQEFRPFSCRIHVKRGFGTRQNQWSIERITVTDVVMPGDEDGDVPAVARYMLADKYIQLEDERTLRAALHQKIDSIDTLYELQKFAERLEDIEL